MVLGVVVPLGVIGLASRAESAPGPTLLVARLRDSIPTDLARPQLPASRLVEPQLTLVSALDEEAFESAIEDDVTRIGSVSIGAANRGNLFNAVRMPESPLWVLEQPKFAYGTEETIESLRNAIIAVNQLYPGTHPIHIGHIGKERGGWLSPHRSHQSGRDVDIGFYYRGESRWYVKATAENFDVPRNWALLSAFFKTSQVEYVFVDRDLHAPLRAEAEAVGESFMLIREVFEGIPGKTQPLLRHVRGHDAHFHVRFASKVAVQNALRVKSALGRKARSRASLLAMLNTKAVKQKKRR